MMQDSSMLAIKVHGNISIEAKKNALYKSVRAVDVDNINDFKLLKLLYLSKNKI